MYPNQDAIFERLETTKKFGLLSDYLVSWVGRAGRLNPKVTVWGRDGTPEDVVELCAHQLRGLDREHFWSLALNTKNRLLRLSEVSVGSLNASIVHPRELFKDAVKVSAASVVVVHNHPSGDPTPSPDDFDLTERLRAAAELVGVLARDHVIVATAGYYSFAEAGRWRR